MNKLHIEIPKTKPIQGLLQVVRSNLERVRYSKMLFQLHAHYHIHWMSFNVQHIHMEHGARKPKHEMCS